LIDAFEAAVFDAVTSLGGRVIKLIGDEVPLSPDIMVAAEITMGIAERVAANDDMPPIHCGAAYGPAVNVGGDVFGPTVNLAARPTSVARPGTLVVPRVDADPLIERWGDRVRRIHRLTDLKGIGQVRSVAIRLSGDEEPVAVG
jgi:adenylate cyclase